MATNIYSDYKGMPCVSRKINPDNWTWVYLYENKMAKKNREKYASLEKAMNTLNEKYKKNKEVILEVCCKFYKDSNIEKEFSTLKNEINDPSNDNVKGILTMRNKISKVENSQEDIIKKMEEIKKEMSEIELSGFDEIVEVASNDMVYAYDMQNYVRLHPEKYKKKL